MRAVIYEWEIDPGATPGLPRPRARHRRHRLHRRAACTGRSIRGPSSAHHYPIAGRRPLDRARRATATCGSPRRARSSSSSSTSPPRQFTHYPQPRIGDDLGSYPHTLRFDAQGRIWYTLTRSNHVCRFDPATAQFTYYRLPPADPGGQRRADRGRLRLRRRARPERVVVAALRHIASAASTRPPARCTRGARRSTARAASRRPGQHRLGAGLRLRRARPLRSADRDVEGLRAADRSRSARSCRTTSASTAQRRRLDHRLELRHADPLPARHRGIHRLPAADPADFTREIEFDDDGNVWTCTSDQEIGPTTRRAPAASSSSSCATACGACGDGVVAARRGLRRRQHRGLRRLLGDAAASRPAAATACAAAPRRATTATPTTATAARRPARSSSACAAATASSTPSCGEECDPPGALCTARVHARAGLRRRRRRARRGVRRRQRRELRRLLRRPAAGDRLRRRRALRRRGVRRRQRPRLRRLLGGVRGRGRAPSAVTASSTPPAARSAIRRAPDCSLICTRRRRRARHAAPHASAARSTPRRSAPSVPLGALAGQRSTWSAARSTTDGVAPVDGHRPGVLLRRDPRRPVRHPLRAHRRLHRLRRLRRWHAGRHAHGAGQQRARAQRRADDDHDRPRRRRRPPARCSSTASRPSCSSRPSGQRLPGGRPTRRRAHRLHDRQRRGVLRQRRPEDRHRQIGYRASRSTAPLADHRRPGPARGHVPRRGGPAGRRRRQLNLLDD